MSSPAASLPSQKDERLPAENCCGRWRNHRRLAFTMDKYRSLQQLSYLSSVPANLRLGNPQLV